jgi:hypothetical protein
MRICQDKDESIMRKGRGLLGLEAPLREASEDSLLGGPQMGNLDDHKRW